MKNLDFEWLTDEFMLYCRSTQLREKTMSSYEQTLHLFGRCLSDELKIYTVDIPHGVPVINWGAFSGCGSLKTWILPNSITQIDDEAFDNCTSLEIRHIHESVVSIRSGSFQSIRKYPNLTIHASAGSYAESFAKENNIPFAAD